MKTASFLILLSLGVLSLFEGCASTSGAAQSGPGQNTSNIPWNTPQSWEGTGQLGSAMGR